ncbi:chymotrypsin-1 [Spodoptera frugiperda]|uniref:Chymotrypsin-1 n=1 Tax=Spodoptera frugiperda TaxID=7108 RepID=A0A9R0DU70_SPOFR|nr:chymotrypsin-1 [Spodoptera frugiperda]
MFSGCRGPTTNSHFHGMLESVTDVRRCRGDRARNVGRRVSMRAAVVLACALLAGAAGAAGARSSRYGFYRSMLAEQHWADGGAAPAGHSRRVFGGEATSLSTYPAACVLLDRYWTARCSAAVVAPRWALTAAHCVSPHIAYVKYNARRPAAKEGGLAPVHYLYRHPGYKVVQEDEGRGVDVTLLHHDVGLVRTRNDMTLATNPKLDPIHAMRLYNPMDLKNEEVQVLGYGRTEKSLLGEELFEVRLRLVLCERGAWFHCVCGVGAARSGDGARGVCSGDSGGPVLYRGAQVGVTSMGPLECATGRADPAEGATSVFTALYNYADLVNATIHDTDSTLRMRKIDSSASRATAPFVLGTLTSVRVINHILR